MSIDNYRSIGDQLLLKESLKPIVGSGSAQNGTAVDRLGFLSAIIPFAYSTSGGVTGGSITCKMQDSADGSTGWNDYGTPLTITLSGTNPTGVAKIQVNLSSAKRFVRSSTVSNPTGGTPASIVSAPIVLGGSNSEPV